MSQSSSGSWSARAPPAGDIIDLDRFMRSARPTRQRDRQLTRNGQLVVDGGSLARKPAPSVSSASSVARASVSRASVAPRTRDKRFSHDSGLSDGSYARKRHRPHRRISCAETGRREPVPRAAGSSSSLRAFRTACERALRDQQQAITRVAQLCQRLSERRDRSTPDTSDLSSTSRSTRDPRRKDKHRTEECKTYKIIMTKLDELNRLFAARGRSPPAGRADARPTPADTSPPRKDVCHLRADARPTPADTSPPRKDVCHLRSDACSRRARDSASSVSVSDKLVSTEPQLVDETVRPVSQVAEARADRSRRDALPLVERAVGGSLRVRRSRLAVSRAADAATLDIAPRAHGDCFNVRTESAVVRGSSSEQGSSSGADPHCGFDLDNPVHLYAQAKRLQALHATTHMGGVCGPRGGGGGACDGAWGGECVGAAGGARRAWAGCVRALRRCLAAPLCCPPAWT